MKSIYIISDSLGNLKIGVSQDTGSRVNQLNCGSANKLTVVYESAKVSNPYKIESILHKIYANNRKNSEWFCGVTIKNIKEEIDNVILKYGDMNHPKENYPNIIILRDNEGRDIMKKIDDDTLKLKKENKRIEDFCKYIKGFINYQDSDYALLIYSSVGIVGNKKITKKELKLIRNEIKSIGFLIERGYGYDFIKNFVLVDRNKILEKYKIA